MSSKIFDLGLGTMFIRSPSLAIKLGYKPNKIDMFAAHINTLNYQDIKVISSTINDLIKKGLKPEDMSFLFVFFFGLVPAWLLWPLLWPLFLPFSIKSYKQMIKNEELKSRHQDAGTSTEDEVEPG